MTLRVILTVSILSLLCGTARPQENPSLLKIAFEGRKSEHKWQLKELAPELPADWSDYQYLVLEMKTSSPQRFSLWIYTADGNRRLMFQPFGQNVWLRASIPLQYFKGKDQRGSDLASTNNRRTDSFWMGVWGPFGELKNVEAIGVTMEYPLDGASLEIRSVKTVQGGRRLGIPGEAARRG